MGKYDFGGWATKYNIACSDGRTILTGAFAHCDNRVVPLVWNHSYSGPESIIGKATLIHRDEGVYAECEFNETPTAENAKNLVKHGDITALSIYANRLKQNGGTVLHGDIKEVSLVLAGANPGASIQEVLVHGDVLDEEATIYNDDDELVHDDEYELVHGCLPKKKDELKQADPEVKTPDDPKDVTDNQDDQNETVADVYSTLTDKQKKAVALIIDQLSDQDEPDGEKKEEDTKMKHNVFDNTSENKEDVLKHLDFGEIVRDAKRSGSFKEAFLAHAKDYGISNIDILFPDAVNLNKEPGFIDRDQEWVGKFLASTRKSPFSRIKVIHADITPDSARAKGYITASLKKEEVFSLLKRTTEPTTVYKKQKLDRDDITDITDLDVVAWLKREMRGKLNEELARAMLVGDGRLASAEDKIKENCIRPIMTDSELYTIQYQIPTAEFSYEGLVDAIIKSRADYEGTGLPNLYITESELIGMLLIKDKNGRYVYESEAALAKTLRVKEIHTTPVMKGAKVPSTDSKTHNVKCILVNPADYTVGSNKGGEVSMFDDFDIDYNQYKYLIETRCSGSLTEPKSAIVISEVV